MGADRYSSKGVGGFLQLFDWNSKSKKKLFSGKTDFPDQSKQGKRSDRSLPSPRYNIVEEDESRGCSVKGSREHSCASSVIDDDDDEYGGVRGPSVVARLMGLDSMPTSNSSEPSSTPFFGAQSLRSTHYQREYVETERENQMYFSDDLKEKGQTRNTFDSKPLKMPGRPIEKFQSEILPPRSAKSIPITQHKLLSPIKSSGMFYSGDAAHIMEAAAKIIESGSETIRRSKMPIVGSSSLPLKVKDLKEKAGAIQEKPRVGSTFASLRIRENERNDAVQEKASSGYLSASLRLREKERDIAVQEIIGIGYSSSSLRMKDKEKADVIQEKNAAGYASSSSFRIRNKERVDAADARLETGFNSGSFRAKESSEAPPKFARVASASEKPVESKASEYLKGQSMNKSLNWSRDPISLASTSDAEVISYSNKGKSVSLAIQAKVNVQKREGVALSTSRSLAGQKEQVEVKSNANDLKNMHKRYSKQNTSGVLRQNNQRQNNATEKATPSKTSNSKSRGKNALIVDSSSAQHKTPGKLGGSSKTRKVNLQGNNNESDQLNSGKNVPRKKRNIDSGLQFEGNQNPDIGLNKSLKSEAKMDRHAWIEDSRKKGIDVVSFTFTSPLMRPSSGFNSPSQMAQRTDGLFPNDWGKKLLLDSSDCKTSSNMVGSDALSLLLEQKLRELTTGIGLSSHDHIKLSSSTNFKSNIVNQDAGSIISNGHPALYTNKICSQFDSGFQVDTPLFRNEPMLQEMDVMDACSSNHAEAKNLCDPHLPSPVSILEGSYFTESCSSSRTTDSGSEGSKLCSSVQACEVIGVGSSNKFHLTEADTDLSDSASSISHGIITGKQTITDIVVNASQVAPKWELNYVKQILSNVDSLFESFSAGVTHSILSPELFEQLENSKGWSASDGSCSSMLERKMLFDSVGEILDLRCRRYACGGFEAFCKGMSMVKRKDKLAEELYKEISGLSGMADCMVDELVDKDMSSWHGKWLNFEAEEFSLGAVIEGHILDSLVDELVTGFLLH